MDALAGKLISKNYDWWLELEAGKTVRIYSMKIFNSYDWYARHKGKKYSVSLDLENMTAQIELSLEII